jgi:hypothetical protein
VAEPYKFLSHYEFEDAEIFFGRDLEIELLLSDVISTRLVLLFAKTGSGKTSLINAGVRPRLEKLDYQTFFIRVEKDPTQSAREILSNQNLLPGKVLDSSLDIQLENVVTELEKPVVIFFDQFEEFFMYVDEKNRKEFIRSIGTLYRNRGSGVHLVFSFREEFFVEMGEFRSEIPTIFHNDSNLRLGWFNDTQAIEAIKRPIIRSEVEIEKDLVEELIKDLRENNVIEPPRLQVVCDTLWQKRTGGKITLASYETLGRASKILDSRVEEDINKNLNDEQLHLFERLLPLLRTKIGQKTESYEGRNRAFDGVLKSLKQGRTLIELTKTLEEDADKIKELLELLKHLHLIKQVKRHDGIYFEWTSDYLADRTDSLSLNVRVLILQRLLQGAMRQASKKRRELDSGGPLKGPLPEEDVEILYMPVSYLESISQQAHLLHGLTEDEGEFLFVSALDHGNYMSLWFKKASEAKTDVWKTIKDRITNATARIQQAENTVRLLGELGSTEALNHLRIALQQDSLASLTVYVLGEMKTDAAMDIYREALESGRMTDSIIEQLSLVKTPRAIDLLSSALKQTGLSNQAANALQRVAKSTTHPSALQASEILEEWKSPRRGSGSYEDIADATVRSPHHERDHGEWLRNDEWSVLLHKIRDGSCTVFLGDDTSSGNLPSRAKIAQEWAKEFNYPLEDTANLANVAQYLAVDKDQSFMRDRVRTIYEDAKSDYTDPFSPYEVLASLPLPLYISTCYDDLMMQALHRHGRVPKLALCPWNDALVDQQGYGTEPIRPTVNEPVVFHLYGHINTPDSLVVTIDDYFEMLINTVRESLMPSSIERAFTSTSFVFLGYRLRDASFQFLTHFLSSYRTSRNRTHVSIQLHPTEEKSRGTHITEAQAFVRSYLAGRSIRVYWGTVKEFTAELKRHWEEFS